MGQAKRRGTFEVRKAQATAAGRDPEVRRREQREARQVKANAKREYQDFVRRMLRDAAKLEHERKIARIRERRQAATAG